MKFKKAKKIYALLEKGKVVGVFTTRGAARTHKWNDDVLVQVTIKQGRVIR